jgi:NADPH:quinone reductase-like Zn-dependent oxidoreductase
VGGETGTGVFESLALEGRMLLYGSLTEQPIQIHSRQLIAGHRVVEGFWLGHWMRSRNIPQLLRLFREIGKLIQSGVLASEIGATFSLDQVKEAAAQAEVVGRQGKVLLRLAP